MVLGAVTLGELGDVCLASCWCVVSSLQEGQAKAGGVGCEMII